jgi:hypothetical protein
MSEQIKALWEQASIQKAVKGDARATWEVFAEVIKADLYRKVYASILITDVVMEEKGQKPTSEDYIRAINHDFGVEE